MILPILVIIASWILKMPLEWSITLTIFSSIHLFVGIVGIASVVENYCYD